MPTTNRRFSNYSLSSLATMDNQMRRIFGKLKPAFGYLQVFRGKLPVKIPGDIEDGQIHSGIGSAHPSVEHATSPQRSSEDGLRSPVDHVFQFARSKGDHIRQEDNSQPQSIDRMNNDHVEHERLPQPQFTEGPSRFVLAKDGSRECVALLVNEGFIAKLQDLFNENRDLRLLDGPLRRAEQETREIERSMQRAQEYLETAGSNERADECRKTIEKVGPELLKTRQWRDELEHEYELIKGNHELSTNHTQWVLETAMREANLHGPEKPLPAILVRQEEIGSTEYETEVVEDKSEVLEHTSSPTVSPMGSVAPDQSELLVSHEELERQAAWDHFSQREQALDVVQAKFDNQRQNYQDNLTKYLQKMENGATGMSRSAFDRRSVQYGQQLTRALIDAEEAFEEAREQAQALGAISSDYGHEFYYGAEYEESWPENKIAEYNASQDWSFIEGWMDDIPPTDTTNQADVVESVVDIDEWDAEEVDVNDSISVIDCEEYRQDIDRYRRICARLEDPCPEARWLGQPDGRVVERRSSFWM